MNAFKGQVGSSEVVVGTNAMIANPTYTAPITSVPQNINDWIDDDMNELAGFKAPFTTVTYGPGIPPKSTAVPNPMPPYVSNHHLNS